MKCFITLFLFLFITTSIRAEQTAVKPPLDGTLSGKFSVVDVGTTGSQTVPVPNARAQCLRATVSGVTHVLPNPTSGTNGATYQFCSDGTNTYTLGTVGGTALFVGCTGGGSATLAGAVNRSIQVMDNTTAYQCVILQ